MTTRRGGDPTAPSPEAGPLNVLPLGVMGRGLRGSWACRAVPKDPHSLVPQDFKRELYQCKVDVESLRHRAGPEDRGPPAPLRAFRQRWDRLEEEIVSRQVGAGPRSPGGRWHQGAAGPALHRGHVGAVQPMGGSGLQGGRAGEPGPRGHGLRPGTAPRRAQPGRADGPGLARLQHQLEAALLGLGQFQHQLEELVQWLSCTAQQLQGPTPLSLDLQSCEIELAKHKVSSCGGSR